MKLPIYQVDAFTKHVFKGNPAAVVPLESWIDDAMLQAIALENNLAETAYFVRRSDGSYDVRWFTPELEIPLCGHATLASGYVLFEYLGFTGNDIHFHSKSGMLSVHKDGDKLSLDFPARPLHRLSTEQEEKLSTFLGDIFGKRPVELFHSVNNYLAVYEHEHDIHSMKPDFLRLNTLSDVVGVIATAPTTTTLEYDCISRYFCPNAGIPEDPVTGSAHCSIVPYWAEKLGKQTITAYQASARGGELFCALRGERVIMAGYCAPYLRGEIEV